MKGTFIRRWIAVWLALALFGQMAAVAAAGFELPAGLKNIAEEAFMGDAALTEVVIPDGCESIGAYAFCNCKNLQRATIPDSVTSIGEHAFDGCPWLTIHCGPDSEARRYAKREDIHYLPADYVAEGTAGELTWRLSEDGDLVFEGTGVIPGFREAYEQPPAWFEYRDSIKSVTVGEGITGIGENAFRDSYRNLKRIFLPRTLETIGASAFYCSYIESLYLPDSVRQIGGSAFYRTPLKELRLSANLKEIPDYCFKYTVLTQVDIPEGVEVLGRDAFSSCSKLARVHLPDSLRVIGAFAFNECEQLPEIDIPAGVTSIGGRAFQGTDIRRLVIPGSVTDMSYACMPETVELQGKTYYLAQKLKDVEIGEGVTEISKYAFCGCSLESISLPSTLTAIGNCAFMHSTLPEIALPYGLKTIGIRAFAGAHLTTVTLPATVGYIADDAFDDCEGLVLRVCTGSYAAKWAASHGVDFVEYDGRFDGEPNEWYAAPVLTGAAASGGVRLEWQGNGVAEAYGVYEVADGENLLVRITGETRAQLYGLTREAHTYVVCPLKRGESRDRVGLSSNAVTVDLTGDADWREAPVITYADETALNTVTLRWQGEADSYQVVELAQGTPSAPLSSVTGNEAILSDVESGQHTYALRALYGDGGSALSAERTILVAGRAGEIQLSETALTVYVGQPVSLSAQAIPCDGPDADISWSSSDEAVATVSAEGLVTGVAAGSASITAATPGGTTARCAVTVQTGTSVCGDFTVEDGVLTGYSGSDEDVVVPGNLGIWKIAADQNNESLFKSARSVQLPDTVTELGNYAFWHSSIESITLPKGLVSVGSEAFAKCKNLIELELPEGLQSVGAKVLRDCDSLKRAVIPGSVTLAGDRLFENCYELEELSISGACWKYGWLFQNCNKLREIEFTSDIPECEYYYPPWGDTINKNYKVVIADGVKHIEKKAFYRWLSISELTLPDTLETIGDSAFTDATNKMESLAIPDSVTSIGAGAFSLISVNTPITLSNNMETIPFMAFAYSKMPYVEIPQNVTAIEKQAFSNSALTRVELPESVVSVGESAFVESQALTEARLTDRTELGQFAFSRCANLATVEGTANNVGGYVFYECTSLLGADVKWALPFTFYGCTSLTSVSIRNEQPLEVGRNCFTDCKALKSVDLPENTTSIGYEAFKNCTALEYLELPEGLTSIDNYAFEGCTALRSVIIPDGVTTIGYGSFRDCPNLTLYGAADSYAQRYAASNSIPFVVADSAPNTSSGAGDIALTAADGSILMGAGMELKYEAVFGEKVYGGAPELVPSTDESVVRATTVGIRATGRGTATVRAKLVSSGEWVSRTVNVLGGFTQTELELVKGETAALTWDAVDGYTLGEPYLARGGLSLSDCITVTPDGVVTAVATGGRLPNLVRMDLAPGLYTECRVYVLSGPGSVKVEPSSLVLTAWGDPVVLTATVGKGAPERGYAFTSSNPNVVSASSLVNGSIQAVSPGTATITATAYNGATGTCEVTVLPKGVTMQTVESYLEGIDSVYESLLNMNLFFTSGGYDYISHADGYEHVEHMDGVDLEGLSQDGVQALFTVLTEGVVEGTADNVFRETSNAYYLADLIMTQWAREKQPESITLAEAQALLSGTEALSDQWDALNYLLELMADDEGKLRLTGVDWAEFDRKYKNSGLIDENSPLGQALKGIGYAGDGAAIAQALLTVFGKYKVYRSVNTADLQPCIYAFSRSKSESVRATAALLEGFGSKDCFGMLLGFYGFSTAARIAWKYAKKALFDSELIYAIPLVGPFLRGAEIGRDIGNVPTRLILNIDDVQRAMIRASFAARAANAYRAEFTKLYDDFRADPLNIVKFQQFSTGCRGFGELVAAEYEAYAALPRALDQSRINWIKLAYMLAGTSYAGLVDSLGDCADLARNIAYPQLTLYSRDILALN